MPAPEPGAAPAAASVPDPAAAHGTEPGTDHGTAHAADDAQSMASGLDALETRAEQKGSGAQRLLAKATPPLLAAALVLALWQTAYLLNWSQVLPAPSAVFGELGDAWSDGTLLPAIWHSTLRCVFGFGLAAAIGLPLGLLLTRVAPLRTVLRPTLTAIQSLPAAALVPVAIIALGNSEGAVYATVLLGAVPSIAVTVIATVEQLPPLLLRAGRSMGATGLRGTALVVVPAALPGFLSALRQGWTFGWRALMTAELITATPLPGIGQMLAEGKESNSMSLVLASVLLILAVGVLVESALFQPLERRLLTNRGLTIP
ncbi:ABC transporter permease [Streptomyces aidingensis]|uniref:NitT/TauT family transport system permease protein n=1 Tax=Streptomyces aidingensis TaxID=910347 RepID=A0A1I1IXJ8_9ACTN|nr:ABC transporter permease [Streptomyces aidingensis]SFC37950.1 NitT/TauT family transport system permease protein [Streptomyces aidingensis]